MNVEERFLSHVNKTDSCWLWTGYVRPTGYASFAVGNRKLEVHRVSFELFVGEIPEDKEIDHLCRVRHCVNPKHLVLATHKDNMARAIYPSTRFHNSGKNHEYTPVSNGKKQTCGICRAERVKLGLGKVA